MLKLIDVVAVGMGCPTIRFTVCPLLQPHHFGFGAVAQVETVVVGLKLGVNASQIAPTIGSEISTRIFGLFVLGTVCRWKIPRVAPCVTWAVPENPGYLRGTSGVPS